MGDHATLDELRNAPPGTVFKERRGAPVEGITLGGVPTQAEYRSTYRARAAGPSVLAPTTLHAWLDALEEQGREINRMLEPLKG